MEPSISLLQSDSRLPAVDEGYAGDRTADLLTSRLVSIRWRDTTAPFDVPGADPLLVAMDFSPSSAKALEHGVDLALALARPLVILHVIHDSANSPGIYWKLGEKGGIVPMEQVAHEKFEKFLKSCSRRWDELQKDQLREAVKVVVPGLPARRIVEVAEKEGASMIILGNRGRGMLSRFLEGSVALNVVKASDVPVTVMKD